MNRQQKDSIISILLSFELPTLIAWWNDFCAEVRGYEDRIYENDEDFFEENFSNADSAVRAVCYGEYHYTDEYVVFNAYGNLESFDGRKARSRIDYDELAEWMHEKGCYEITEVWYEDLFADFVNFVNTLISDDVVISEEEEDDYFQRYPNLLTDDWTDVAEEIVTEFRNKKNNK